MICGAYVERMSSDDFRSLDTSDVSRQESINTVSMSHTPGKVGTRYATSSCFTAREVARHIASLRITVRFDVVTQEPVGTLDFLKIEVLVHEVYCSRVCIGTGQGVVVFSTTDYSFLDA